MRCSDEDANANSPSALYARAIAAGEICEDAAQRRVLDALDAIHANVTAQTFWRRRAVLGAYLFGGVGGGKTLLMDLFYQSLPHGTARRAHFHRFMQSVYEQKNAIKQKRDPLNIIGKNIARKHRVLCLDEFQVTDITDAMLLYGLLSQLFKRKVTLIATSNTRPDELYAGGLQRARFLPAIDLLKTHAPPIALESGRDYRMRFLQNAALFLTPLSPANARALQQTFARLCGAHADDACHVMLNERPVPAVAVGGGVAWFEFAALCETPRARMDYIALCEKFHTVLIANIKILDALSDDAARRLIELIDEMYDRGVKLVASAADAPEALYQGKRLAQAFRRTASRLREMQSDDYLTRPHARIEGG